MRMWFDHQSWAELDAKVRPDRETFFMVLITRYRERGMTFREALHQARCDLARDAK